MGEYSIPTRIMMLIVAVAVAVMISFGMALSVAIPNAEAVNTCKDSTFTERTDPPFGQQTDSCVKGSTEETTTKHGRGDGQGNTDEECVKHTGHGDVPVPCE